jgi:hypothetical protein
VGPALRERPWNHKAEKYSPVLSFGVNPNILPSECWDLHHIKEAMTRFQKSEDYWQWLKEHPNGINSISL